ncbi:MAG: ABC transporter permease, partial [Gemmatimonadales bacterium]
LVGVEWNLLPVAGTVNPLLPADAPWITRALDVGRHLILPAVTLSVVTIGAAMRFQRNAMIEVLRLDFVRTARAKGVPESQVLRRHAWRNALFPVITLFGLWLPLLATGAVFVESVFHWTGLGLLAADAVAARDYPVLIGSGMLVAVLVVLGGFLTDLAYFILDPRVRET